MLRLPTVDSSQRTRRTEIEIATFTHIAMIVILRSQTAAFGTMNPASKKRVVILFLKPLHVHIKAWGGFYTSDNIQKLSSGRPVLWVRLPTPTYHLSKTIGNLARGRRGRRIWQLDGIRMGGRASVAGEVSTSGQGAIVILVPVRRMLRQSEQDQP